MNECLRDAQSVVNKCARVYVEHTVGAQVYLPPRATVNAQHAHSLSLMSALLSGIWHTAALTHVHVRVTVMTKPGGALFEVQVDLGCLPSHSLLICSHHTHLQGTLSYDLIDSTFTVVGDINRINRYGNSSYCVHTQLLRKYCVCV
jgi:hypothetical protein